MSYCKINGTEFDVTVSISSYEENFNVLDGSNAGRVMSGRMIRDIIGTYIGHSITFYNNGNNAAFDALWEYLFQSTRPLRGATFCLARNSISF